MKEWKIRQQIYNRTWHDHDDLIRYNEVVDTRWIVGDGTGRILADQIGSYFRWEWTQLRQPDKSFAVAIVYAKLLEKYFGEDFYVALDDPDLLLDDIWFIRYSAAKHTYDPVIGLMNRYEMWDFENNPLPQVQTTVHYFKKEFSLV